MSSLHRNVLTSGIERGVSALLTLGVVPFQVRLLGMEAYGLLSFVTSLQVLCNILDLGLAPMIVREIAGDQDPRRSHSATVLQTFSAVYWTAATVLAVSVFASSSWLANHWLRFETLPYASVVLAIRLMAISILLRWPVSLYAGSITGSQRLDVVNMIRIVVSAVRVIGGLGVLFLTRSLADYLLWLGVVAIVEVAAYMFAVKKFMPASSLRPRLSVPVLRKVWRYSIQMNAISLLSAVFVQSDRLVISRMLPVAELGFYSLAYTLASGLSVIPTVLSSALFPQLALDMSTGKLDAVRTRCDIAVQLAMYAVACSACVLIFFGHDILAAISAGGEHAYRAMSVLSVGFVISAVVSIPFTLAVASGETRVPLLINAAALGVYVPLIIVLVRLYGITGAACAWAALNGYYLIVMVPILQRRLPMTSTPAWLLRNVVPFLMLGVALVGGMRWLFGYGDVLQGAASGVLGCILYAYIAGLFVDGSVRSHVRRWLGSDMPIYEARL